MSSRLKERVIAAVTIAGLTLGSGMAVAPVSSTEAASPDNSKRITLSSTGGCDCRNPVLVGNTWVGFVGSGGYSHYQCECPEPRQPEPGCENPVLVGNTWVGFVGGGDGPHFQRECPPPKGKTPPSRFGAQRIPRRGSCK